jgi:hypothetical protein
MRARATLGVVVGLTALFAAEPARAETNVRGFTTASLGVSDNATFALGGTNRYTSALIDVRPGVALFSDEKRDHHVVGYALRLSWVAAQQGQQTYAHQVFWRWIHEASFRDTLTWEASVTEGKTSPFYLLATTPGTPLAGATPTVIRFASGRVREGWTRQLGPRWSLTQSLAANVYAPLDDDSTIARTTTIEGLVGVERTFRRSAVRVETSASYVVYGPLTAPGAARPGDSEFLGTVMARYRRDLSLTWQAEAGVGASVVESITQGGAPIVGPLASATLRRVFEDGNVAFTLAHATTTNIYLAQTAVTDEASVNAIIPIDRPRRVRLLGNAAYGRSRNVLGAGAAGGESRFRYYRVDGGVMYIVSNGVRVSGHLQRLDETADAATASTAPSFAVDTALVDVTIVWPSPPVASAAPF